MSNYKPLNIIHQHITGGTVLPPDVELGEIVINTETNNESLQFKNNNDEFVKITPLKGEYYTKGEIEEKLEKKSDISHDHNASAITGGTIDIARIPTGTGNTEVAVGNHEHDNYLEVKGVYDINEEENINVFSHNEVDTHVEFKKGITSAGIAGVNNQEFNIKHYDTHNNIEYNHHISLSDNYITMEVSASEPEYPIGSIDVTNESIKLSVETYPYENEDGNAVLEITPNSLKFNGDEVSLEGHTHPEMGVTTATTSIAGITKLVAGDLSGETDYSDGKAAAAAHTHGQYADKEHEHDYASKGHTHNTSAITGGTFNIARIPTGTTSTTVSRGDHEHDNYLEVTKIEGENETKCGVDDIVAFEKPVEVSLIRGITNGTDEGRTNYVSIESSNYNGNTTLHLSGDSLNIDTSNGSESSTLSFKLTEADDTGENFKGVLTIDDKKVSLEGHNHNDLYYTETEVDNLLKGKLNNTSPYVEGEDNTNYNHQYSYIRFNNLEDSSEGEEKIAFIGYDRGYEYSEDEGKTKHNGRLILSNSTDPESVTSIIINDKLYDDDEFDSTILIKREDSTYVNIDSGNINKYISGGGGTVSGDYAEKNHKHNASDITGGTIDIARIPTGTGNTEVAVGNHRHNISDIDGSGSFDVSLSEIRGSYDQYVSINDNGVEIYSRNPLIIKNYDDENDTSAIWFAGTGGGKLGGFGFQCPADIASPYVWIYDPDANESEKQSLITEKVVSSIYRKGVSKLVKDDLNGRDYADGEAAAAAHTHSQYSPTNHTHNEYVKSNGQTQFGENGGCDINFNDNFSLSADEITLNAYNSNSVLTFNKDGLSVNGYHYIKNNGITNVGENEGGVNFSGSTTDIYQGADVGVYISDDGDEEMVQLYAYEGALTVGRDGLKVAKGDKNITFDGTDLKVNKTKVSLEGHRHNISDIDGSGSFDVSLSEIIGSYNQRVSINDNGIIVSGRSFTVKTYDSEDDAMNGTLNMYISGDGDSKIEYDGSIEANNGFTVNGKSVSLEGHTHSAITGGYNQSITLYDDSIIIKGKDSTLTISSYTDGPVMEYDHDLNIYGYIHGDSIVSENDIYSGGKKVSVDGHKHNYISSTGSTSVGNDGSIDFSEGIILDIGGDFAGVDINENSGLYYSSTLYTYDSSVRVTDSAVTINKGNKTVSFDGTDLKVDGKSVSNVQSDWNETNTSSDAYIKNKPTIPTAVTETTVSNWGFTKNTGTYSKPSDGIPKSDLSSTVQTSLNKADTALQSIPSKYATTGYVDNKVAALVNGAPETLDTLDEIASALKDKADIVDILNASISNKMDKVTLSTVATSGDYNDLINKPTIPVNTDSATTESGHYQPSISATTHSAGQGNYISGIKVDSKSHLIAVDISTLPSFNEQYKGTVTGVKMNDTTHVPSNGVVNLGTVITAHQDISGKQDKINDLSTIRSNASSGATAYGWGNHSGKYLSLSGGTLTGSLTAPAFYETSDERLKTFEGDIDVDFNKLSKLRKSVYYLNNDDLATRQIGMSAQEVVQVYPQLVKTELNDPEQYMSLDYSRLSVVALKAVDKLYEINQKLEERVKFLEEKLISLDKN